MKTKERRLAKAVLPLILVLGSCFGYSNAQVLALENGATQVSLDPPASSSKSMKEVLNDLRSHYSVDILFADQLVEGYVIPNGTINYTLPLEKNLAAITKLSGLQFKKDKKGSYLVSKQAQAKNAAANTDQAQTKAIESLASEAGKPSDIPVSGTVTDPQGQPLPGVTVIVKGTTTGAATGLDGTFSLNVPEGGVLVFSFIGFARQEYPVTAAAAGISIVLQEEKLDLNEVVVVGYGTQNRRELTTSVASVGGEAIARQPVAGFDQALQGQAAGVQVTSPSGSPGAGINVRIRGNNSVSLTNSPLYVIDGVPVLPTYDRELSIGNQKPNPLNTINPNDIESIDVLKDGAAAAIYGLRASNGVVVITTKRGKAGKAQINFNMYTGFQGLRKKIEVLNANQFAHYFNQAQSASGFDTTNPSQGYPNLDSINANTNWQDQVYRTGVIQNYQLGVSGGTDKTRYYISGGYFKQQGIILNSGFDRYNFKLNLDQQVNSIFKVGSNLNLSRTNNNGSVRSELGIGNSGVIAGALAQIPTIPVRQPNGQYSLNPFQAFDNPIGNLLETHNKAITFQAIGNVFAELNILDNLTLRSSLGLDYRNQIESEFVSRDYPGMANASPSAKGSGRAGTTNQTIWLWENTLTYRKIFGEKHLITLLAGHSVQASDRFTTNAAVTGYPSNAVPYLLAGTTFSKPSSYEEQWGLLSFFGRANYSYDDRYLATLSLRADGTSRFASHFGYFPAIGLGWRASKESFFPRNNVVTDLKLRGSFGANGNQEIYVYDRFSTYTTGLNYQGASGIIGGIGPDRIGNGNVSWETTFQYNGGVDLGFFGGRAQLTVDYYMKNTVDLLTSVPLAPSTGAQTLNVIQNIGEIQNKGWEFGLNTTNLTGDNGGVYWSSNLNMTMNQNKVVDLGTLRDDSGNVVDREIIGDYSITRKGSPMGSFYGYKVQGIFQTEDQIANAPTQPNNPQPGDIQFADINKDGVIDAKDRTIIGNPNPKMILGFTNNISFKGFELSFLFQGSIGNDIYNQNRTYLEGMADPINQSTRVLNRWTPTNTNTDIPRAVRSDPNQNNRFSTRFVEDGTYLRLKNLTIAYNFPGAAIKHIGMSALRIYGTAQNLLTWTHYLGYDPEVSADPFSSTGFGRDYGVYPQARTCTLGVNVTF